MDNCSLRSICFPDQPKIPSGRVLRRLGSPLPIALALPVRPFGLRFAQAMSFHSILLTPCQTKFLTRSIHAQTFGKRSKEKNNAGANHQRGFIGSVLDKTRAILLRRIPLTETSLIVHWCSDEFGLLKTVAKGARRPKSPFAGKLDLFFDCELEFVRSRRSDLHTLKDLIVHDARLGLRNSYLQTQTATYFSQLVDQVAEGENPIPELVDLLRRALDYLAEQAPTLRALQHFETELARHLGVLDAGEQKTPGSNPIDRIADLGARIPKQRSDLLERLR